MNDNSKFWKGMMMSLFFSLTVVVATTGFTACGQNNGNTAIVPADSGSVIPVPVADSAQLKADWKKFKADADRKIRETDDSLAALKKRISKFDKKLKVRYDRDIAQIERKNDTLKVRLNNYKAEGKEKWEDFKTRFDREMDEVKSWLRDSTTLTY